MATESEKDNRDDSGEGCIILILIVTAQYLLGKEAYLVSHAFGACVTAFFLLLWVYDAEREKRAKARRQDTAYSSGGRRVKIGDQFRHYKRKTDYEVIDLVITATNASEGQVLVVYRGLDNPESHYARAIDEFCGLVRLDTGLMTERFGQILRG